MASLSLSGASSGEKDCWEEEEEEEEEEEAVRRRSGVGGELRRCGGRRRSAIEDGLRTECETPCRPEAAETPWHGYD